MVAVASRVIEIVEHEHDCSLLTSVQIDEQIEHFHLVGEVDGDVTIFRSGTAITTLMVSTRPDDRQ